MGFLVLHSHLFPLGLWGWLLVPKQLCCVLPCLCLGPGAQELGLRPHHLLPAQVKAKPGP